MHIAYRPSPENPRYVEVKRECILTGRVNALTFPMSPADFLQSYDLYMEGALIQNAFPALDAGLREFLMTGITPDHWERFVNDTLGDE
jgi:hypothetical protein